MPSDADYTMRLLASFLAVCDELSLTFGEGMALVRRCLGVGQCRTLADLLAVGLLSQDLVRAAGLETRGQADG